ncbi:hypothetical protein SFRURICE_001457 [Spodoptera frugiperda]|nr:hypothetical protein SFRURICE_001457 [Spodoptera frugiperda]
MAACVNCYVILQPDILQYEYHAADLSPELALIIEEWCGREVPNEAWACNACWMRAYHNTPRLETEPPVSLEFEAPVVPAQMQTNEVSVPAVIPEEPNVDSVPASSSITVPSSETESWADQMPNIRPPIDTINLVSYARISDTTSHCFVPDCVNPERIRVSRYLKRSILCQYKIYISENARVCHEHSMLYNWDILNEFDFIHSFNRMQIENMLDLLCHRPVGSVLNFEDIENCSDRLCHYWTGLTVANFLSLFNSVGQIETICNKAKTALGMYLVKLRTGESFARIASLFLTSKGTVANYVKKARSCLSTYYVPLHLGVGHMTREQHNRGFRDAIGLLTSLGYSIKKPESLDVGERQLSTLKANKSRMVTLCRWVVEVVNGRFKRDFKIFRADYFNCASRNLMTDFKVAAAILNCFHPLITDHPDAEAILTRAQERFHMPNTLADYVIEGNINRHRVNFVSLDGQLPHLDVFPVMEMRDLILFSLGIYQIKQARSYYGEHIRENGTFRIEVDTNLLEHSNNSFLLRGRIRSRHQSNKIYCTYILLNLNSGITDWCQRIAQYYCSCIIGKRTIGSCAHVMTIVWYLGWARHQENMPPPPASFLDSILVRDDVENEEDE